MTKVNTVTGPVDASALGLTLMHEHIIVGYPNSQRVDRPQVMERAVRLLNAAREVGVRTIVDPAPVDLGRDSELMAEASEKSGVQIVCATGMYTEARGFPPEYKAMSLDELAEMYARDIEQGVDGTGIRAGIIKCATGPGWISAQEEKALRAAARAQQATGVPIVTHTDQGSMGPRQAEIFAEEGMSLSRAMIGHSDGNPNPEYHLDIVRKGAFVGLDRIGNESTDEAQTVRTLGRLIAEGFEDQVLLSHDRAVWMVGRPSPPGEASSAAPRMSESQREKYRRGFVYLFETFIPQALEAGVPQATIDHILTDNPRRLFE